MNSSPDLTRNNQVVYNQDFTGEYKPNSNLTDTHNAPDLFGHGDHVAGIIASSGATSSCGNCTRLMKGVSPGVRLVNLRALNKNGVGTDSTVIAAIQQAIALKTKYNIRVLNISLGRPVYESYAQDPLCQAVEQAWKAGIVVVVAAGNQGRDNSFGNQGYGTVNAPGNDPYVITVGAMKTMNTPLRTDDWVASYSSKGPTAVDHIVKPDLVAPGNHIVSLLASSTAQLVTQNPANNVPVSYYQSPTNTSPSNVYFNMSGTSMATPVVSGAVADLLQANPALTPDQVKALLMKTAYKIFPSNSTAYDAVTGQAYVSYYDIFTIGAGYLDVQAALQNINSVPTGANALSPVAIYDPATGIVNLSSDAMSLWATRAMWGAQTVWGSSVVSGTKAMWGAGVVWGTTTTASSSTTYGTKALWGAKAMWGATTSTAAETNSIVIKGEQ
jgi:serine protease AprX